MTFQHGVYTNEIETPVRAVGSLANPIAFIGKAKISGKTAGQYAATAGKWTRLQTRADAVAWVGTDTASESLGFDSAERANDYRIPGFLGDLFDTNKLADIVVYNVCHFTTVTDTSVTGASGVYTLANGYVKDLTVTSTAGATFALGSDYTFDHKTGKITAISGGTMTATATILVDYKYADDDPSTVTVDDIYSACLSVDDIFQQNGIVPSMIIAPLLTTLTADTTYKVISGMITATSMMDDVYTMRALVGVQEATKADMLDTITSAIATTDNDLSYAASQPVAITANTPDEIYALKWLKLAADTGGIIGVNPASNEFVTMLTPAAPFKDSDGNTLNAAGINTFVSHNGMKTWGNYTSVYSESGEFLDNFDSIRFILHWIMNNCNYYTRTYMVDKEINPRKINYHVNVMQQNFIDKAIRFGALLKGSKITFNAADNPVADMLAGKYKFSFGLGFIPPAGSITNEYWYNTELLTNLFSGGN